MTLALVVEGGRIMREDDLPKALIWFAITYGPHDRLGAKRWFRARLGDPTHLFLIGEHHALVGVVNSTFYYPKRLDLHSLFIFGDGQGDVWETLRLLRALIVWGRKRGATKFHLSSELGQADLTPLATRLGMTRDMPAYVMDL